MSKLGAAEQREYRQLPFVTFEDRDRLRDGVLKPLYDERNEARRLLDAIRVRVETVCKAAIARQAEARRAAEDAAIAKLFGGK